MGLRKGGIPPPFSPLDLELLYIAQRRGYRIAEVPINWAD